MPSGSPGPRHLLLRCTWELLDRVLDHACLDLCRRRRTLLHPSGKRYVICLSWLRCARSAPAPPAGSCSRAGVCTRRSRSSATGLQMDQQGSVLESVSGFGGECSHSAATVQPHCSQRVGLGGSGGMTSAPACRARKRCYRWSQEPLAALKHRSRCLLLRIGERVAERSPRGESRPCFVPYHDRAWVCGDAGGVLLRCPEPNRIGGAGGAPPAALSRLRTKRSGGSGAATAAVWLGGSTGQRA